jgi:hypothetical protein
MAIKGRERGTEKGTVEVDIEANEAAATEASALLAKLVKNPLVAYHLAFSLPDVFGPWRLKQIVVDGRKRDGAIREGITVEATLVAVKLPNTRWVWALQEEGDDEGEGDDKEYATRQEAQDAADRYLTRELGAVCAPAGAVLPEAFGEDDGDDEDGDEDDED